MFLVWDTGTVQHTAVSHGCAVISILSSNYEVPYYVLVNFQADEFLGFDNNLLRHIRDWRCWVPHFVGCVLRLSLLCLYDMYFNTYCDMFPVWDKYLDFPDGLTRHQFLNMVFHVSELPFGWEKVEDPHYGTYFIEWVYTCIYIFGIHYKLFTGHKGDIGWCTLNIFSNKH